MDPAPPESAPAPRRRRWPLCCGLALLVLVLALAFVTLVLPGRVEASRNRVLQAPPYQVSEAARRLHARLTVADLHADTLLWDRDLLARGERGHVDLPRLREANVALQMFTCVTKSPSGQNIQSNSAEARDNITLLAIAQRWPLASWTSLLQRALHQAARLDDAVARSDGGLVAIRTREDLRAFLAARAQGSQAVACLLGIEGAHCLEGKLEHVETLERAGVRMVGLTHFFDNELGGSAHGEGQGGLTELGREVVRELEARGILVDLAHAAPAVIDDVLAQATRPVVVSHTGVRGVQDNPRNLSDAHLRGIAATGGVIGIGFWETAVGGRDAAAIARSIRYTADLVGVEHVALGSDFDGSVTTPFDVTGLPLITEALLEAGFDAAAIEAIMGGNLLRVLGQVLPPAR